LQLLGKDGVGKLAQEQKQKREIQQSRIDIKNKKLFIKPLSEQIKSAETTNKIDIRSKKIVNDEVSL